MVVLVKVRLMAVTRGGDEKEGRRGGEKKNRRAGRGNGAHTGLRSQDFWYATKRGAGARDLSHKTSTLTKLRHEGAAPRRRGPFPRRAGAPSHSQAKREGPS